MVGRNGEGKSTLLRILTGEITQDATNELQGSLWRNPNVKIGHLTQHSVEEIEEYAELTVVEYADKYFRSGKACSTIIQGAGGNIRQFLGGFGLGGKHALRPIGCLSGGERMRLRLAQVLSEQPHLLLLDEITNFIDIETLDSGKIVSSGLFVPCRVTRDCADAFFARRNSLLALSPPTHEQTLAHHDAVAAALDAYEGSVIIVSHNQAFLSAFL